MSNWLFYSLLAVTFYGVAGFLQKLATNRISAHGALVSFTLGYLPWFFRGVDFTGAHLSGILIGILVGFTGRSGEYLLLASLASGAKVSVAVPLTAMYPLITLALATVFLAERLTATQWFGIALALAGGILMSYEARETKDESRPQHSQGALQ